MSGRSHAALRTGYAKRHHSDRCHRAPTAAGAAKQSQPWLVNNLRFEMPRRLVEQVPELFGYCRGVVFGVVVFRHSLNSQRGDLHIGTLHAQGHAYHQITQSRFAHTQPD